MAKKFDRRSVRIEIEADPGGPAGVDDKIVRVPSSKLQFAVGVAAAGLVALLLLAFRPERSSTAEGESVTSTTVAATVEDVASDAPLTTSEAAVTSEGLLIPTSGSEPLQSVVRAPVGFIGLGWAQTVGRSPNIVRSVEGVDWSPVDVDLADSIPLWDEEAGFERIFEALIRTDDGYAMVMSTIEFSTEGESSPSAFRIERLISPDGATWDIDGAFDPIVLAEETSRITSHHDSSFVYMAQPSSWVNDQLRDLLAERLVDGGAHDDVCWAEPQGERQLVLNFCNSASRVTIESTDLVEPEAFEVLSRCASFLSQSGAGGATFWAIDRESDAVELQGVSSFLLQPKTADDGTVVALDLGLAPWLDQSSCDGLVDLPETPPPALVVWPAANRLEPKRIPFPDDEDPVSLLSVRAEPVMSGRALLFVNDTKIRSIDIDTGEWADVVTLGSRMNDETGVRFSEDGSLLVQLDSARITVTDIRTGERRSIEDASGGNRPGFPWIFWADHDVAFAFGGNSMFKVDLPTA